MERVRFKCDLWGWFSSSSSSDSTMDPFKHYSVAQFSMEGFDDRKGVRRIENAKNKLTLSVSFRESAYRHLFAGCSEKNSYNIFYSLNSLGIQIQQVAQTSRKREDHMVTLLNHSKEVYEPSRSYLNWSSWIDIELSEEIEDFDYDLPEETGE